jgi:hypothetical protein
MNILYYLLTRQWRKLVEYQFDALALDVAGATLTLSREELQAPITTDRLQQRLSRFSPRVAATLKAQPGLLFQLAASLGDSRQLMALSEEFHLSPIVLREVQFLFAEDSPFQQELFTSSEGIRNLEKSLDEVISAQVLYLPTYRRIERDLEKLFPGLDEQVQRRRASRPPESSSYLEFVEFGMTDVERRFSQLLGRLKERARFELNSLAASYLGEVIRGEADSYDATLIAALDDSAITRILNRVEERNLLDAPDREQLRIVINRLKTAPTVATAQEKYVGHFFSKLARIHRSLADAEAAVESFVQVCNGYLVGKEVVFDDRQYAIALQHKDGQELELRHLSSGEKQIVSLFTHIYLAEASEFIVRVLSASVRDRSETSWVPSPLRGAKWQDEVRNSWR